jgi:hypothetical protein
MVKDNSNSFKSIMTVYLYTENSLFLSSSWTIEFITKQLSLIINLVLGSSLPSFFPIRKRQRRLVGFGRHVFEKYIFRKN